MARPRVAPPGAEPVPHVKKAEIQDLTPMAIARVNGTSLYYELLGPESAPVLVLCNGILMNAATSWALQVPALSRQHRLLLHDCRGQGQSAHPDEPYSMAGHAADLVALLDALGIERAHIGGISYGGEVAQAFGIAYRDRTRSLILADTVSEVGAELRRVIDDWIAAARTSDADTLFETTVGWNFSPAFIAAHGALMADARRRYRDLDFPAVIRLCESFLGVNFTARLAGVKVPTCLIYGEADRLKGLRYAEIIRRAMPHAELHVLPGAGHASCWELPGDFNRIVLDFLARQPD